MSTNNPLDFSSDDDLTERAKDLAYNAKERVRERLQDAGETVKEKLSEAGKEVGEKSAEAKDKLLQIIEKNPLTSVGIAALVGASIAFLLKK